MSKYDNYCEVKFEAKSENEAFARMVVAGFVVHLDPALDELNELKTAVSEIVTNSIIHAYNNKGGEILMTIGTTKDGNVDVTVTDYGCGIADLSKARELFYTSRPDEERSGMGLTIIEAFTDEFHIKSVLGEGTTIKIRKIFDFFRSNYA